jgi:WD40 repeat protein
VESGRQIYALSDQENAFRQFDWHPNSQQFVLASNLGDVTLRHVSSAGNPVAFLPHNGPVTQVVYAPDGRTLLVGTGADVRIWDLGRGNEPFALNPPEKDAFSPSMQIVQPLLGGVAVQSIGASAAEENLAMGPRELIARLLPPGTRFEYGALSPDHSRVLTSHHEGTRLQLWDASTRQRLGELLLTEPHQTEPWFSYAAFSADSRLAVAADWYGTVRLVDARSAASIGSAVEHGGHVFYAACSPDGQLLVTCGADHMARLWHTQTGQAIGEKLRHEQAVTLATFSADGRTVATASLDGTVRLWDNRGNSQGLLKCKSGNVLGLLFRPNGLLLVVSSNDRMRIWGGAYPPDVGMRLWDVASGQDVSPQMKGTCDMMGVSIDTLIGHGSRGGRITSACVLNRSFDPPSDDQPVADLVKLAQLYSRRQLDARGNTIPLGREEWQALWRELRAKYPEEFAAKP